MRDEKRLELQSMPPEVMALAKDQFGMHFIQFEIWVGKVIDKAYAAGQAQRAEGVAQDAKDAALWRDLPLLHQMDLMVIFGGVSSNDVLLEKLESWIKQKRESAAPGEGEKK